MSLKQFQPASTQTYVNHYLHGGSDIGNFFVANQLGFGLSGLISSIAKKAVPLIKQNVKSFAKKSAQKAIPILKREGGKFIKDSANELLGVINKKQSKKDAWKNTKDRIKKRALDIIENEINPKKPRIDGDIFS